VKRCSIDGPRDDLAFAGSVGVRIFFDNALRCCPYRYILSVRQLNLSQSCTMPRCCWSDPGEVVQIFKDTREGSSMRHLRRPREPLLLPTQQPLRLLTIDQRPIPTEIPPYILDLGVLLLDQFQRATLPNRRPSHNEESLVTHRKGLQWCGESQEARPSCSRGGDESPEIFPCGTAGVEEVAGIPGGGYYPVESEGRYSHGRAEADEGVGLELDEATRPIR